jgi:hypothetical protein
MSNVVGPPQYKNCSTVYSYASGRIRDLLNSKTTYTEYICPVVFKSTWNQYLVESYRYSTMTTIPDLDLNLGGNQDFYPISLLVRRLRSFVLTKLTAVGCVEGIAVVKLS